MTSTFLASLRRITSNGRYIPEIDGLRFIAIVSVLCFHISEMASFSAAPGHMGPVTGLLYLAIHNGARGVPLFFAISGMVLGLPFARHHLQGHDRVGWRPYLLRRVTRLEPPYIANLLLRLPIVIVVKHLSVASGLWHLGVSLVYADWAVFGAMPTLHPPSWSLAVEVQFYLLAPLLAWLLFRWSDALRWTASVVAIVAGSVIAAHLTGEDLHGAQHLSLLYFSQYFVVGLVIADLYLTVLPRVRESWLWDVVAVPLWVAFFTVPAAAYYVMPPMLLVLFCAAFRGRALRTFLGLPFVAVVGGMCYSIYLTHSLTLQAGFVLLNLANNRMGLHLSFWQLWCAGMLLILPVILAVATVFFVLIERPCMDKHWPRKLLAWFRRRREASPAAL